jgi:hypothetical protein
VAKHEAHGDNPQPASFSKTIAPDRKRNEPP